MADEKPLYVAGNAGEIAAEPDFAPRPSWPKVIGIISIVFGALGMLCGIAGVGMTMFGASMMGGQTGDFPPVYANPPVLALVVAGIGTLWAIVLIVAGSMTAARKPVGRPLHLLYAVVAIVLGAVSMYNQVQIQAQVDQWVKDNPDKQFAKQQKQGGGFGQAVGYACGGFFGFGWPLFTLVWFGAVKRRGADIAEGAEQPVA